MLDAYLGMNIHGEPLWMDYLMAFGPQTIQSWGRTILSQMNELLQERGVHVAITRGRGKAQPLIDVVYRKTFEGSRTGSPNPRHIKNWILDEDQPLIQPRQPEAQDSRTEVKVVSTRPAVIRRRQPDGGPPEDDKNSDDEYKDGERGTPPPHKTQKQPTGDEGHHRNGGAEGKESKWDRTLGMTGLMRSYHGKQTFAAGWDEDLDNSISVYKSLSNMCEVSDSEKLRTLPVILSGDSLSYYSSQIKNCATYEEAVEVN